ncbi:MAG: hypothetical protein GC181_13035 [Bacteroidetes bacterium]|nr:hypothetical protein [Bacteroidota bacterium]
MCYERALDIDPQSIKAHKSMGRWELSQSHYPEAIEMLEFVKKSGYTEEIEYYNWLAIAKANWGDIEGSLSDLNYYLKSVPRDLNALILKLELLKFNPENYPEMLVVLDSCLILAETDWNKANFFLYKSVLSFHLGKYDSALLYINRSLELSPNTAEYHVNKAFYLYYIYEETDSNITISAGCKSELELALKLDDHCWQAYALFGVCYYYGGERELACRNMKLAYEYGGKIDPESIQFICHGLKLGQMEPTNLNVEIITFPKLN